MTVACATINNLRNRKYKTGSKLKVMKKCAVYTTVLVEQFPLIQSEIRQAVL